MNNQPKPRGGFFTIATWQRTDDLAMKIYQTTKTFPPSERYRLISQMQRSAVSVATNIAEGSGRQTLADYIRFLYISKGSLTEVEYLHSSCPKAWLPIQRVSHRTQPPTADEADDRWGIEWLYQV